MRFSRGLLVLGSVVLGSCARYHRRDASAEMPQEVQKGAALDLELKSLPFKHVEWQYTLSQKPIRRITLAGEHLFVETVSNRLVAVDRFIGRVEWEFWVDTDTPLDWPPGVALGVPDEVQGYERQLAEINRKIKDMEGEPQPNFDRIKEQQKNRNSLREKLRVAQLSDNVYFVSRQILYCIERRSGRLLWTRRLAFVPGASLLAIRSFLFVPSAAQGRVQALSVERKGELVDYYRSSLSSRVDLISNRPLFEDPRLYFVCQDGNLYAYDVGTKQVWTYSTERELRADPVLHALWDKDEKGNSRIRTKIIFFGGMDGAFYAVDANSGGLLWKYEASGVFKTPAMVKDRTVYAKTENGYLFAWDVVPTHRDQNGKEMGPKRDGELRWKFPLAERFLTKGKMLIYFLGVQGTIYSVDEYTGQIVGRTAPKLLQHWVSNTTDDFIYAATADGTIIALRESQEQY